MVKAIGEMYEAKPLGLVSFRGKSGRVKGLFALVCAKKSALWPVAGRAFIRTNMGKCWGAGGWPGGPITVF